MAIASRPSKPASARPSGKLPCMLAQSVISGTAAAGGVRPRSAARTSAATQATATGRTSMCGRARTCGIASTSAASVIATASAGPTRRARCSCSIAKAAPTASAVTSTTPRQPPAASAAKRISCDTHSLAIHGAPANVCE